MPSHAYYPYYPATGCASRLAARWRALYAVERSHRQSTHSLLACSRTDCPPSRSCPLWHSSPHLCFAGSKVNVLSRHRPDTSTLSRIPSAANVCLVVLCAFILAAGMSPSTETRSVLPVTLGACVLPVSPKRCSKACIDSRSCLTSSTNADSGSPGE